LCDQVDVIRIGDGFLDTAQASRIQ
jgi:hypothetical protein